MLHGSLPVRAIAHFVISGVAVVLLRGSLYC